MKVTFVHLGRENLGIEYLSAVLEREGHEVTLAYDPGLFGINDNVLHIPALERLLERRAAVMKAIEASAPDIVAFSVFTGTYVWSLGVAKEVKERFGAPVLFGGIHPTLVPEEVMARKEVDYVIVGEAEEAILEFLDRAESRRPPRGVRNVWYREGGEVVSQPVRPPISDLDRLPYPDKTLFEKEVNLSDDYVILSARGCPFRCTYCCESHWNRLYVGRYFRRRGVESVIGELGAMKRRYGFREVMFNDPIFFTDRRWLRELMERYRAQIGVPFRCFGKAGFLDEEVGELLRWGGCYAIEFGLQTFNPEIRKGVLGRPEGNEEYRRAFAVLDRLGIRYDIDHMFGLPGESTGDHAEAARFYKSLHRLNRIKCHHLTYFPRLEILEKARDAGILQQGDEAAIERGEMDSDFFHRGTIRDQELARAARAFQTLFKLLPVLPAAWVEGFLRKDRWRLLLRVPFPLVFLGQIAVAIRGRDYRFSLYVRYYLLRLRRAIQVLPHARAAFGAVLYGGCSLATIPLGSQIKDYGIIHAAGILMGLLAARWAWAAWRGWRVA